MLDVNDLSNEDVFLLLLREGIVTEDAHDTTHFLPYVAGRTTKRPALPNTRYYIVQQVISNDPFTPEVPYEILTSMLIVKVDDHGVLQVAGFEPITDPSEGWNKKYGLEP